MAKWVWRVGVGVSTRTKSGNHALKQYMHTIALRIHPIGSQTHSIERVLRASDGVLVDLRQL
jgi:hypothetical protein